MLEDELLESSGSSGSAGWREGKSICKNKAEGLEGRRQLLASYIFGTKRSFADLNEGMFSSVQKIICK